jgi:DNA repair protein RecO (recombination protein O)
MSLAYIPGNITGDISRSSIALFISEILYKVIREEDVNKMLYSFIESSVTTLDSMTEGISNFHLWFLVAFTAYAGIGPTATTLKNCYFDMISGQFTELLPMHPDYLEPYSATVLNRLLSMTAAELGRLHLAGAERSEMLEKMIKYYSLHLPGIRQIRSLQIMKEIFK